MWEMTVNTETWNSPMYRETLEYPALSGIKPLSLRLGGLCARGGRKIVRSRGDTQGNNIFQTQQDSCTYTPTASVRSHGLPTSTLACIVLSLISSCLGGHVGEKIWGVASDIARRHSSQWTLIRWLLESFHFLQCSQYSMCRSCYCWCIHCVLIGYGFL